MENQEQRAKRPRIKTVGYVPARNATPPKPQQANQQQTPPADTTPAIHRNLWK